MIVCLCKAVSDRAVRDAIARGAGTLDEVALASGAGRDCGGCHGVLEEMLKGQPADHGKCSGNCAGCTRHQRSEATGATPLRAAASPAS
jgi:bacterioferritin-associated ferredoxin